MVSEGKDFGILVCFTSLFGRTWRSSAQPGLRTSRSDRERGRRLPERVSAAAYKTTRPQAYFAVPRGSGTTFPSGVR